MIYLLIRLLLLNLSLPSLFGHPAPTQDPSEALCSSLKTLGQSLEDARLHGPLCVDSELRTECTTGNATLDDVLKKCLDGIEFDRECLEEAHMNLAKEVDNKDCFCGGLVKFSKMLTTIEALLCEMEATVPAKTEKNRQEKADSGSDVAFTVHSADPCCLENDSASFTMVKFTNIITNVGGGWNRWNGVFTTPESGNYNFFLAAFSKHRVTVALMKNNDQQVSQCYIWPDSDYLSEDLIIQSKKNLRSCSQSVVLSLRRGDQVYLKMTGSMYEAPGSESSVGFNSFTGYKI